MKIYYLPIAFALFLGVATCSPIKIQAGNSVQRAEMSSNIENPNPANAAAANSESNAPRVSAAEIAGSYKVRNSAR